MEKWPLAAVYFLVTGIYQAIYLWWIFRISTPLGRRESSSDRLGTCWLYAAYISMWLGAGAELLNQGSPLITYVAGMLLVCTGIAIRLVALRDLGTSFSADVVVSSLVIRGIYAKIRHPLHLGYLIMSLGMAALAQVWWVWSIWLVNLLVVLRRGKIEDRVLREAFGDEAIQYQHSVPSMNLFVRVRGQSS